METKFKRLNVCVGTSVQDLTFLKGDLKEEEDGLKISSLGGSVRTLECLESGEAVEWMTKGPIYRLGQTLQRFQEATIQKVHQNTLCEARSDK